MIRLLVLLILYFDIIWATWYFSEPKICNPKQDGLLPFTGFRIYRQYKLEGYIPSSLHFLSITHCRHGKPDYEKQILTTSSIDIDWDRPFCMLKPDIGTKAVPKVSDKVYKIFEDNNANVTDNSIIRLINGTSIDNTHLCSLSDIKSFKSRLKKLGKSLSNLMETSFDNTLEKVIKGQHIQYTGKKAADHYEDIRNSDPRSSLEWESRLLICYKMARRKKYAKRNILFYMPFSFVGGLFECPIPQHKKKEIFKAFKSGDFLKTFDFRCDNSIATPVLPLIAQDCTKQWIETKFNPLNPVLIQRIPYLSTASLMDMRFSASDTHDMFHDTWASHIDVNEEYAYSDLELNIVTQAIALSMDYLHKMFRPMDISGVFHDLVLLKSSRKIHKSPAVVTNFVVNTFKKLSLDQKVNLVLSSSKQAEESMHHLYQLQGIWDNLMK